MARIDVIGVTEARDTKPVRQSTIPDLDDFKALDPFFRIIEKGLEGIADGGHFFDLLAEDVIFDYIITTPGYPRHVEAFLVRLYEQIRTPATLPSRSLPWTPAAGRTPDRESIRLPPIRRRVVLRDVGGRGGHGTP